MTVKKLIVGPMEANCYILADEKEKILRKVNAEELEIIYIVNTHAHIDHIGANDIIREETGACLLIHSADAPFLEDPEMNLSIMIDKKRKFSSPTKMLEEGDQIQVDGISLRVLHTPGHTPGSICLHVKDKLFTGDTLFAGSVGRTDLPGGNLLDLENSIKEKLLVFSDEVIVYPGHGLMTKRNFHIEEG